MHQVLLLLKLAITSPANILKYILYFIIYYTSVLYILMMMTSLINGFFSIHINYLHLQICTCFVNDVFTSN